MDGNSLDGETPSPQTGYKLEFDKDGHSVKISLGGEYSLEDIKMIALELAIQKIYKSFTITDENVPKELT